MKENCHPISVIIPVYNVSDYIEKCARSVFEQTLEDLEIIFINDCTPDNSVKIINRVLDDYPNRKAQTRIINNPSNTGQAGVRRIGILASRGDYIIHCDGDDWVDPDLYEKLYREAVENFSDIVFCDEKLEYKDKTVLSRVENLPPTGKELIKNWHKHTYGLFCHNKLVKASLYKDNDILPWVGLNMWEDNGLFARLLYHAGKISKIEGPVYHYNRTNVNSMTAGYGIKQVEQMLGIASNLADFFELKPDAVEFTNTIDAFKYLARLNLVTDSWKNYKRFLKTFPESKHIAKDLDINAFSSRGKIRFFFVKFGLASVFIILFKFISKVK